MQRILHALLVGCALLLGVAPGAECGDQSPSMFISREQAINIFMGQLDPFDPDSLTTAAFMFNLSQPDSVLPPGTWLADYDSTFVTQIPNPAYFFWVDRGVNQYWTHRCQYVLVDAQSGFAVMQEAETWPVLNGTEYVTWLEQGDASPDLLFGGGYPMGGVYASYTPVAQPDKTEWGIIIVGRNLHGTEDEVAIEGDIERVLELWNGAPYGPKLPRKNIIVVGDERANGTGTTNGAIRDSINQIPEDCDELHVAYVGHGRNGGMITRSGSMPYSELARKLICRRPKKVCITIMACKSGSAITGMAKASKKFPGETERTKLTGTIATSSEAGQNTDRQLDGSAFFKAVLACSKTLSGDLNGDGKIHKFEAVAWARAQQDTVRRRNPQGFVFGDGSRVTFGPPKVQREYLKNMSSDGSERTLCFELEAAMYTITAPGSNPGPPTVEYKRRIYMVNPETVNVQHRDSIDVVCLNAEGEEIERFRYAGHIVAKGRWCIRNVSNDCVKIKLEKGPQHPFGLLETAFDLYAGASIEDRVVRYNRGQPVFSEAIVRGSPGEGIHAWVTPLNGWGLDLFSPMFTISALSDSELVEVFGVAPDTA